MSDRLIRVPAGARSSLCTGHTLGGTCRATIYWVREYDVASRAMKSIPVDCESAGCQRPSEAADSNQLDLLVPRVEVREGFGLNHSLRCPDRRLIAQKYAERRERERASA